MINCKHCNNPINGKFCSECGQAAILKRIDGHYVKHEIEHLIHFEKGIFYTIKELLIRPGQSIKTFIHDDRNRLVKPIVFVIVASLIYTVTLSFFNIKDGFISHSNNELTPITNAIFAWLNGHLGYANIFIGLFITLWIKLFFKKYEYNFYETLILMCFVMGMGMMIGFVIVLAKGIIKVDLGAFGGIMYFIYCSWAIAQFFDEGKIMSYVKSIIAFFVGFMSCQVFVFVLGLLLDWLVKIR